MHSPPAFGVIPVTQEAKKVLHNELRLQYTIQSIKFDQVTLSTWHSQNFQTRASFIREPQPWDARKLSKLSDGFHSYLRRN